MRALATYLLSVSLIFPLSITPNNIPEIDQVSGDLKTYHRSFNQSAAELLAPSSSLGNLQTVFPHQYYVGIGAGYTPGDPSRLRGEDIPEGWIPTDMGTGNVQIVGGFEMAENWYIHTGIMPPAKVVLPEGTVDGTKRTAIDIHTVNSRIEYSRRARVGPFWGVGFEQAFTSGRIDSTFSDRSITFHNKDKSLETDYQADLSVSWQYHTTGMRNYVGYSYYFMAFYTGYTLGIRRGYVRTFAKAEGNLTREKVKIPVSLEADRQLVTNELIQESFAGLEFNLRYVSIVLSVSFDPASKYASYNAGLLFIMP